MTSDLSHSEWPIHVKINYEAKGKQMKTIDEIKTNEDETYEIVSLFWRGLYDQRVRVILKQRMDGMKIEDLASITQNIESSYEEMKADSAVHLVDAETNDLTRETNVQHVLNITSRPKFHGKS